MVKTSSILNGSKTSEPKKKYDVIIAEIDANNNGNIDAIVKSKLNTSIAKIIAAMGALKIEDNAPAAAQPINKFLVVWFKWNNRATLELIAAPVATVGPSNPTEPPKPTVIGAVNTEAIIWWRLIIPFRLEMANKVEGMPWLTLFRSTYFMTTYTIANPITGNRK